METSTTAELEGKNNLEDVSTDLQKGLQMDDNIATVDDVVTAQKLEEGETERGAEAIIQNIAQCVSERKSFESEDSFEYYEGETTAEDHSTDFNKDYFDESWKDFQPASQKGKSPKHKEPTSPRKKQKDYKIISIRNSIARAPSYFKYDKATTTLLAMVLQYRHVGEFHNVVGKGINSDVIHAHCYGRYHEYFPCGNAVKVYKLCNDVEKNKTIFKRVQKENNALILLRDRHFTNNFPHPVCFKNNVIVMSFIGDDQETAPSITSLSNDQCKEIYHSVVKEMDAWYNKLNLVHGNLSSKTIRYWLNVPHYLGWSHAVPRDHPKALKKLMMDCQFVTKFFAMKDVPVKPIETIYKDITGFDDISSEVLEVIYTKDLWQDKRQTNPNKKPERSNSKSNGNHRFK